MGMGSLLGGHVRVECDATISENVAVHQFVTVGNDSFIGAHSKITTDVPGYMRVEGNPSVVRGIDGQRLKERELAASHSPPSRGPPATLRGQDAARAGGHAPR